MSSRGGSCFLHTHILLDICLVYSLFAFSFYNLLDIYCAFVETFGTLVFIFKFIFSILLLYPCFVALYLLLMLCISLSTSLLCPLLDFISLMQLPYVVSIECWICK